MGRSSALLAPSYRDMSLQMAPDLLEALRHHEPAAAECLVGAYGERAYRLAARITRNEQDAEEVVQDAFYAVIRQIDTFRGESAFGSWLYRIVANAAYQKLRARRRRRGEVRWDEVLPPFDEQSRHVAPIADWSPRVNDPSIQTELRMVLEAPIDELPPAYRIVLVLCDVEGRSIREIAELLDLSDLANRAPLDVTQHQDDPVRGRQFVDRGLQHHPQFRLDRGVVHAWRPVGDRRDVSALLVEWR